VGDGGLNPDIDSVSDPVVAFARTPRYHERECQADNHSRERTMDFRYVVACLEDDASLIAARDSEKSVPSIPGLYSIFVDDPDNLPSPLGEYSKRRGSRLIYVGKATKSLQDRLIKEDLRHMKASTFFRGIGAVLGFRPPKGSLVGKKNQNNYRFSDEDTKEIVRWIDNHLLVRWIALSPSDVEDYEPSAIRTLRPLLNTTHNPEAFRELATLRRECRSVALSRD
jgi:hypothetical protein